MTKLRQCKLALQEKLEIIKQFDDEILQLVNDEEVENETEHADTFKERVHRAMIDSSRALVDIYKFNYLNTLLEGPASEAISGLKLTTANYNEAVAILKRRFGKKQLIIVKRPSLKPGTDRTGLKINFACAC